MNKQFKRFLFLFLVLVSLLVFPFPLGHGTVTVDVASVYPPDNAATLDTTPDFKCTPISDVSEYVNVTLYVDGVASGTVTNHPNGTEVTITCNWTLPISDEKIPWYFSITDEEGTYQTEKRYMSIGAYFKAPAVLLNPNATTEHWTYYLNASVLDYSSSPAISIPDDNITLNGQGYTLDGNKAFESYGINVDRTSSTTTNITITNVTITDWTLGLYLFYSDGNTISKVTANNNDYGLYLENSGCNTISDVTANNNEVGICLFYSDGNILTNIAANNNRNTGLPIFYSIGNIISNVTANNNYDCGLYLYYAVNNTVHNCNFQNERCGIYFVSSGGNTVHDCKIHNNTEYGVYLYSAGEIPNIFYNNLFNNTLNVLFEGIVYVNYWNTTKQEGTRIYSGGPYIGGNFWANPNGTGFSQTCNDADKDGFSDDPYVLNANNIDYLAYSLQYEAPSFPKPKPKPAPKVTSPTPTTQNVVAIVVITGILIIAVAYILERFS